MDEQLRAGFIYRGWRDLPFDVQVTDALDRKVWSALVVVRKPCCYACTHDAHFVNRLKRIAPMTPGYTPAAKALHWLIFVLVFLQFVVSTFMPDVGPSIVPGTLINLHLSLGVLILVMMAARLAHRLLHPVPLEAADTPAWERSLAKATHWIFYFILMVGPFLGWASASSHRLPVTFFGLFTLPALAEPRARWANTAGDIHTYAMWTLLAIIALHAAAALYHHFVRHDGVLRRMLPSAHGGRAR